MHPLRIKVEIPKSPKAILAAGSAHIFIKNVNAVRDAMNKEEVFVGRGITWGFSNLSLIMCLNWNVWIIT